MIKTFAEAEQVLATRLPGYTERPQQQALAAFVEKTIAAKGHGLAEAGCGVGKSLGTMIPAILNGQKTVVATATKALMEQYCLAPETRVLTADLRYVEIGSVREGDDLVGFDEERVGHRRRFRTATVLSTERIMRPSYRLTFDDGTSIVCSEDHRWLRRHSAGVEWITTKGVVAQAGDRAGTNIVRLFDTWGTGNTRQHGYLAAAFDGEGHLTQKRSAQVDDGVVNKLGFAQRSNEMLDEVSYILANMGFKHTVRDRGDICSVGISDRREIVRFLGEARPHRLLAKFSVDMLGTIPTQEGKRVVAKEYLGETEVVAVETTTGTFVAEGLASHNCNKDIPFLEENLGVPFTWALVKGRSNYLCMAKATGGDGQRVANISEILAEVGENEEHSGDFEHFTTTQINDSDKVYLSSSSDDCPGKRDCPFGEVCFAERAKQKGREAQVVVTNFAMLLTDLKVRELTEGQTGMLGEYDLVLLDEAHELESYATSSLQSQIRRRGIEMLVGEAGNFVAAQGGTLTADTAVAQALVQAWATLDEAGTKSLRFWVENSEPWMVLIEALQDLRKEVLEVKVTRGERASEFKRNKIAKRAANYADRIAMAITAEDELMVRWIEAQENRRTRQEEMIFNLAPVHVGSFLSAWLWETTPAVLISATLSVRGDFGYLKDRLGLPVGTTSVSVGTPFDYDTQALLFVPDRTAPSPKDRHAWLSYSQTATLELIRAAQGGALLLFTSRTAMQESYRALAPRLADMGLNAYMQGEHGTNKQIAQAFNDDVNSVLFGLSSFMTGVDFQGETCRLVVIDKLPFPVPTEPVFEARSNLVEKMGGNSFSDLTIPAMTLTLEQAYGRLIRTSQDKGVVAILDSRLESTGYGRKIVSGLPRSPKTNSLSEVAKFYAR